VTFSVLNIEPDYSTKIRIQIILNCLFVFSNSKNN